MFEDFNVKKETTRILKFLKQETKKAGFKKVIVPLSGGVDSSTVAFLVVKALGKENVLMVKLPYQDLNQDKDADLIISELAIPKKNALEVEISELVDLFAKRFHLVQGGTLQQIRFGNLMARVRMTILFDLAKKHHCLVCGTENKSEYLLGYFTRFGDEASDLEPIRYLYKTQVVRLAHYLGVPERIIKKPPTAGLWSGQTDENELGFSYQEADPILFSRFDKKLSWEEIKKISQLKDRELVDKVESRVESNNFKHEVPKSLELDSALA